MNPTDILIVEDEHALAAALATVTRRNGMNPLVVPSGARAITAIRTKLPGMIILDIGLPDMSGLQVLRECFGEDGSIPLPVVIITAHGNLENAIAARRMGVDEYLTKPLNLKEFERALETLSQRTIQSSPVESSRAPIEEAETTLIGAAPAMQPVFRDIAHACTISAPLVISGDTGVGKTLAARVIHANSIGQNGKLIVFQSGRNHVKLGETLLEWEVFGGRTLLIENVSDLSTSEQAELLHRLEVQSEHQVDPSKESAIRIIATTKSDLYRSVTEGSFDESLYYRLRVLDIRIPPVAERREDIPALSAYFLGKGCSNRPLALSPEVVRLLCAYSWPGNVLELRHAIDYAIAVCGGTQILPQHLPAKVTLPDTDLSKAGAMKAAMALWVKEALENKETHASYSSFLDHVETELLKELLHHFDDKPTRLAEELRMNRTTLRRRCARLGIQDTADQ